MGWLEEFIGVGSKLLSNGLGIYNLGTGENLFYNLLFIFLTGWISLLGFILVKKTKLLVHWRIPNLVNLSIILLVSLTGFVTTYLVITNFSLLTLLIENIEYTPMSFPFLIFFMAFYIVFVLELIHQKRKGNKEDNSEVVPSELKIFIPKSIVLSFGLILTILSQLFLLKYLNRLPFELVLPVIAQWRYIIVTLCFLLLGVTFIICAIANNKLLICSKKFEEFTKNHPKVLFFSLGGIMLFLSITDFIEMGLLDGIFFLIISIILILSGFFNKWIKNKIISLKSSLENKNSSSSS